MLSVNEGLNTPYYYLDDFMFFEFDGISSSTYNIFKINSGDDLVFHNSQNSSHEYVTPSYSNRTYYLGSKSGQKEFKWKCAGEGLTLPQIREVLTWLEEGKVGTLRDDHMGTWCYDVVVDSISDFNKWVQNDGTYIVEFDIGFKHIGSVFARSYYAAVTGPRAANSGKGVENYTSEELVAVNEYGIPEVVVEKISTGKYKIRVARIGDKGYSMKCKTQVRRNGSTKDQVIFKLTKKKNSSSSETIVDYEYTHEHQLTLKENCTLEYNSNTNLLLLNGDFIENTDTITIRQGFTPIINEFKVGVQATPVQTTAEQNDSIYQVVTDSVNFDDGMFVCCSRARGDANIYQYGQPSSTGYYADICFDNNQLRTDRLTIEGSMANPTGPLRAYVGYYDEYTLECTYTGTKEGDAIEEATPTVEITQYTIL